MERSLAVKKLGKLLGKNLGYRVDSNAPTQDEREAAKAALPAVTQERKEISERMQARKNELLEADSEYRELMAKYKTVRDNADRLVSISHTYKFTAGTSNGMFFVVRAQGDTWEDVIDKIQNPAK
jgi:hypothetical protein